ncbi:hypothetical protein LWI29_019645 [Acer saccharum]|uniref:Protein kinase domain-containing protein n=1 Tax=Acer saccharum TaxID=4024 RepID=A0AA39SUE1_ACESA|nr:hypothetical protein LWI29_018301 [Acer saccharum]KAK0596852.1 hypothetical protein LWI29_019645 [Acer saccharum]
MVLKIMSRHWLLSFLVGLALSTVLLVHAQNQTGFISIDCGTPKDFAYTERTTGINYISDANFTDTGVGYNISSEYNSDNLEQPFLNVRSFPEGSRSCYTLNPVRVNTVKFLIRASFMYGNYDGQNKLPRFDLLLEADEWDTVQFKDASTIVYKEIIHVPKKNYIDVCLVNTGFGTPFISALELRPLRNGSYPTDPGISLLLFSRLDIGSMVNDKENFRLKDDAYDRIWSPYTKSNWVTISSPFSVHNSQSYYLPPSTVMQTSAMPENGSNSLVIDWEPSDPTSEYFAYLYFAELDQSQADNETREEEVFFNGEYWDGPYTPSYLSPRTVYSLYPLSGQRLEFSFNKTKKSLLPPLVNALELYQLKKFQQLLTNQKDGMDLSNNSLTGPVPDFLLQLPFLTMLNLSGNDLKGSVPVGLIEKQKSGLLSLSVDGNPDLCLSTSCTKKKTIVVPVLASFLAVSVLIAAALSILWILKARIQGITWNKNNRSLELKNRRFSYSDVVRITNNFERIVGQGGFGTVYHGNLDDHTQVAVKMLSLSSIQGHKQFQTEVELLLRVHHKNLTSLVGYCDNGTNMGLIYEFMSNGNLESHLLDEGSSTADILSWGGRLRIATETAQVESETHVSTIVAGTPGYLDPEYYKSNRLTEKSDVYSFGVVLLQIITSKPAIEKSEARTHIIEWVSFMLEKGDIKNVVDPRLQGDFDTNSVWRAVEVAMACVSQTSAKRPTMNQVVIDLNESLEIEIARTNVGRETESRSISLNLHSVLLPDDR